MEENFDPSPHLNLWTIHAPASEFPEISEVSSQSSSPEGSLGESQAFLRDPAGPWFTFKGIANQILAMKLPHILFDFLILSVNLESYLEEVNKKKEEKKFY